MRSNKLLETFKTRKKIYALDIASLSSEVKAHETERLKELKEPRLKCRHVITLVLFAIAFLLNGYKINIGVGIVAMVNNSALTVEAKTYSDSCPNLMPNTESEKEIFLRRNGEEGDIIWSPEMQGNILGSYFLGYVIFQVPCGRLIERYGSKWFLFGSSLITAVSTFLIPVLSWWSTPAVIAVQALRGMAQGFTHPGTALLISNWAPKTERGFLLATAMSGASIGSSLGSLLTGLLCASLGKWPASFYLFGALGLVVSSLIVILVYENPNDHPRITKAEHDYILNNQENALRKRRPNLPWAKILTSVPAYALMYGLFGQYWALTQFLASQSIYLGTILHYPIQENGIIMALTFTLQFVMAVVSAWISSYLLQRNIASVNWIRKFWNFLASFGFSACLLGIYIAGCNRNLSLVFSLFSTGFVGFGYAGCRIVPTDMTPTFAGTFNGLCITVGSISSVLLPFVVGHLTDEMQTIEQWNKVFFLSIGIVMSSAVVFALFGSAEVQPWNNVREENTEDSMKEDGRF